METGRRIEEALTAARRARRLGGDELGALEVAWDVAVALGPDAPLAHRVAWKRAKAFARAGLDPLPCLEPLAETGLFAHYPRAVAGAESIARAHQDTRGYGHPPIRRLWLALADHQRELGHTAGWAHALLQLAWDAACTGDLAELDRLVAEVERADAAEVSVDAHHTALRAASWTGDADRAGEATEALLHAFEDRGAAPTPVVQEALLEAAVLFGGAHPPAWRAETPYRSAFQRGLREGGGALAEAMELGRAEGPEWALAPWSVSRAIGVGLPGGEALIESSGCWAFRR
ncbi:MAG: hypothetical protein KC656_04275 [Myxococcales bacterium]|nr:hypothetical protein [Myxococcales bacterium]MCB9668357.1 hypothetical protein [Alphaproteobacteria bacterium]